jgi:O-antigen/teichoic acid export membrane protein
MRRQLLSYIPANIVPAFVAFATIYVFTRFLPPSEYGDYSFAFSAVMIGQSALFYPLTVGATRIYPREERTGSVPHFVKSAYGALGLIDIAAGLMIVAVFLLVPLGGVGRSALLLALPLLLLRGLVTLNQSINRMEGRVGLYTVIECAQPAFGMLIGTGLILTCGASAQAVMLGLIMAALLCALTNAKLFVLACRHGTLNRALIVELARFGWPLALAFLTSCILQYADRFIVGTLGTVSQLGVYAVAYSLVERPTTMLCTSVSSATFPMAVRALEHQGKHAAGVQAGANGAVLLALTVPACIGLALCAGPLANVLVGPDYRTDTAALIPIMAFTALARGVSTHFVDHAFHLARRPALMLQIYAPAAAANIALDIIAVPYFGMFAAAWIALACQSAALALGWFIGRRHFPLFLPRRDLLTVVVATASMAALLSSIRFAVTPLGLAMMVTTGAATYVVCTLLLNGQEIIGQGRRLMQRQVKLR